MNQLHLLEFALDISSCEAPQIVHLPQGTLSEVVGWVCLVSASSLLPSALKGEGAAANKGGERAGEKRVCRRWNGRVLAMVRRRGVIHDKRVLQ